MYNKQCIKYKCVLIMFLNIRITCFTLATSLMKASSFTKSRRRLSWSRSRMNSSPILWTINAFSEHGPKFLFCFYHQAGLKYSFCVVSDLSDDLCQTRVAHNQPAARSDAVGLVLELVRLHFIKVLKTESRWNMLVTFRQNVFIRRRLRDTAKNIYFSWVHTFCLWIFFSNSFFHPSEFWP